MRFDVAQQLKEPVGSRRRYVVDGEGDDGPMAGEVTLLRTDQGLLASVQVQFRGRAQCSRCLRDVGYPLALAFEEEFFPTVDVMSGALLPRPEDADAFLIDEGETLDLGEALRQYRLLAEPMSLLCSPDCRGLCPICGHNLNLGACGCPPGDEDPRWRALEALRSAGGAAPSQGREDILGILGILGATWGRDR